MINKIKMWFHHFLNPHCADCKFEKLEYEERKRDLLIDEYRELLASARLEISRLTQALVDLTKPPEVIERVIKNDFQPLPRKQRLNEVAAKLTRESHEEAQRIRANKIREADELRKPNELKDDVAELENKLGLN